MILKLFKATTAATAAAWSALWTFPSILLSAFVIAWAAEAAQFLVSQGAIWSAVNDPGGSIAEKYGISSPPTTFLIDPSGRITVEPLIGPSTQANLDQLLKEAKGKGA